MTWGRAELRSVVAASDEIDDARPKIGTNPTF
jgi:hypothetical protein